MLFGWLFFSKRILCFRWHVHCNREYWPCDKNLLFGLRISRENGWAGISHGKRQIQKKICFSTPLPHFRNLVSVHPIFFCINCLEFVWLSTLWYLNAWKFVGYLFLNPSEARGWCKMYFIPPENWGSRWFSLILEKSLCWNEELKQF